jgi:hypothetical protein
VDTFCGAFCHKIGDLFRRHRRHGIPREVLGLIASIASAGCEDDKTGSETAACQIDRCCPGASSGLIRRGGAG